MKKCIAYRALGYLRSRWVPCGLAVAGDANFCKKHGETVIGGVLGLWVAGLLEPDAAKSLKIRGNISQKKQGSARRKLPPNGSHNEAARNAFYGGRRAESRNKKSPGARRGPGKPWQNSRKTK